MATPAVFSVSEPFESLRANGRGSYQETGDVGASSLGEVVPLGETLFPEEEEGTERVAKSKRGPKDRQRSESE